MSESLPALAAAPRRHVALLISGLAMGGVQRSMLTLAGELAERGHRVDLLVLSPHGPFREQVPARVRLVDLENAWLRLPIVRSAKRRRALASPPFVARYLREARPDALVAASHYVNVCALLGRDLAGTGTPVIVSQRTHLSRASRNGLLPGLPRPILGRLVRHTYPRADGIVAVSDGVADDLARSAHLPRERITTIYNPADSPDIPELARAPLGHPWLAASDAPLVVGVGRLQLQKGFETLLRAFAKLREQRPVRLAIVGDGRRRLLLEPMARALGVADDVLLPGFDANPFRWMARASLFVLSSRYEGLPGVLIQALACGCPVVATDCPSGPREILEDGRHGALVPVGDAAAMAEAMQKTLDAPPPPERQRARARHFSVDACADRYETLIERAVGQPVAAA